MVPDIDIEFSSLLPSSDFERRQLERNLRAEGCRDPLVVWPGKGKDGSDLLVDGHTRLGICQTHDIPYKVHRMDFHDRNEAMVWIITNQIGRRNLNLYCRSLAALKLESVIAEQVKSNQRLSLGRGKKGKKNSPDLFKPAKTNDLLAQIANTSSDTIQKVRRIEQWADAKLKAKLTAGQVSINSAIHKVELKIKEQRRGQVNPISDPTGDPDLSDGVINKIICADVLDGLKRIPDRIVSLIITDPPWAAEVNYSGAGKDADNPRYEDYLQWLKRVFSECERVLGPGGRLVIAVDSLLNRHPEDKEKELRRPLYADLVVMMREIGEMKYRDRIVVIKDQIQGKTSGYGTFMSPLNPSLRHNSMDLLIWSKGTWQLQPPVEDAGGGLTREEFEKYTHSTWYFSPVKRNRANHPCPFNPKMVSALIRMYSFETQLILDPFCGLGTVPLVAIETNRRFIGIDKSRAWCDFGRKQLAKAKGISNSTGLGA